MSRNIETALWCEVISQAIRDATVCGGIPAHARDATRAHARSWFRATNRDFLDVCNLAGLDPEAVSERSLIAIAHYDRDVAERDPREVKAVSKRERKPSPARLYTNDGITLPLSGWSKHLGLTVGALASRLRSRPIEEALSVDFRPRPKSAQKPRARSNQKKPRLVTINGVSKTTAMWLAEYNISRSTHERRRRLGYSYEEALKLKPWRGAVSVQHTIGGITKTMAEWAAFLGIGEHTLRLRIRKGRSLAEAIAIGGYRGASLDLDAAVGTGGEAPHKRLRI